MFSFLISSRILSKPIRFFPSYCKAQLFVLATTVLLYTLINGQRRTGLEICTSFSSPQGEKVQFLWGAAGFPPPFSWAKKKPTLLSFQLKWKGEQKKVVLFHEVESEGFPILTIEQVKKLNAVLLVIETIVPLQPVFETLGRYHSNIFPGKNTALASVSLLLSCPIRSIYFSTFPPFSRIYIWAVGSPLKDTFDSCSRPVFKVSFLHSSRFSRRPSQRLWNGQLVLTKRHYSAFLGGFFVGVIWSRGCISSTKCARMLSPSIKSNCARRLRKSSHNIVQEWFPTVPCLETYSSMTQKFPSSSPVFVIAEPKK